MAVYPILGEANSQPSGIVLNTKFGIVCAALPVGGNLIQTSERKLYTPNGSNLFVGKTGIGQALIGVTSSTNTVQFVDNSTSNIWNYPVAQITVFALYRRTGAPSGTCPFWANCSPSASPFTAWGLSDESSILRFNFSAGGTFREVNGTAFTGGLEFAVGTYNGATAKLFRNGIELASGSFSGNLTYPVAAAGTALGNFYNFTGSARSFVGEIYLAGICYRGLTDAEVKILSANPWQIFEDPFASFFYIPAAAGVSGTLAQTLDNTTLAASGTPTLTGSLAQTLAATTLSASGTTTILGTLAQTLAATTLAASGTVGSPSSGTVVETLDDTTLSASGTTTVVGTAAQTLANTTLAAAGTTNILGTVGTTLGNDTLAASGSVGSAVSGSVSGNLANTTLAASGTTTLLGTVSYTMENTVSSAQGTTSVTGTVGVTLANTTLAATGTSGFTAGGASWRFLKLWISKLGF